MSPTWKNKYEPFTKKKGPVIHFHGKPIKSVKKAWRSTLVRAGIQRRLRLYDLRHYFVTKMLEEGADIKALAEVVGSDPKTLMKHYQHVSEQLLRATISKMPPLRLPEERGKAKKSVE